MWRRGEELGKGAFGSVYLAQKSHSQVQAVKTSPVSMSSMLSRERRLLEKFEDCPSIIHSFGFDITIENGKILSNLFLEYASGGTLLDQIKFRGLPKCDIKRYTESILIGLDYIHKKRYAHCDIKPQNILLVEQETPLSGLNRKRGCEFMAKIADFGLAKKSGVEIKGGVRGILMYLAPESYLHNNYEPKVDIWALGCVVLQMFTGKTPWDEHTKCTDTLLKIRFTEQLPEIPDWVPEEARDFLDRCLVRDPESRWSTEMLLKHPFVPKIDEEEYLSIVIKPSFSLSDEAKRKRMKMLERGFDFGVNWLGLQCGVERDTMIPSVNTRIKIFD